MIAEYPHMRTATLADNMGRSFSSVRTRAFFLGLHKTPEALRTITAARDNSRNTATRFGTRPPWNKGKAGSYQLASGKRLGAERIYAGYLQRKVKLDGPHWQRWVFVHVIEYEKHYGRVPAGHMVTFKDGNRANLSPDNLALISIADNLANHSVHACGPELFQLMHLRGQVTRELNKRGKA